MEEIVEKRLGDEATSIYEHFGCFMRSCIFSILSVGTIPTHIAFIMDGNRRFAKKMNFLEGAASHRYMPSTPFFYLSHILLIFIYFNLS